MSMFLRQAWMRVVPADRRRVAVAADHEDVLVGLRHLDPGGEAERPPVGGVQRVEVHVAGEARGAPDPGHEGDVVLLSFKVSTTRRSDLKTMP